MQARALVGVVSLWLAAIAWPAAESEPSLRALTSKLERLEDAAVEDEGSPSVLAAERDARETELKALEGHVADLRVKAEHGIRVTAAECHAVEQRLDRLMARMGLASSHVMAGEIPEGVELDTRLRNALSSRNAALDDGVEVKSLLELRHDGDILLPAGVIASGRITLVGRAIPGHVGELAVRFDRLELPSGVFEVELTVVSARGDDPFGDAFSTGAGTGAPADGVMAGLNGLLAGVLIDAAGRMLATTGGDVELPSGTILRLRFGSPLTLQ